MTAARSPATSDGRRDSLGRFVNAWFAAHRRTLLVFTSGAASGGYLIVVGAVERVA